MIDKTTQMIARTLGISVHKIHGWRLDVANSQGRIRSELVVECSPEHAELARLEARAGGSLVLESIQPGIQSFDRLQVGLRITLLYGKETQHLMKALHQTMAVRGPKRRKN